MNVKYYLRMPTRAIIGVAVSVLFCNTVLAETKERQTIKCYLQLEDKSNIVHQFVSTKGADKDFTDGVIGKGVFMADGKSEVAVINVHECVLLNESFKNKTAQKLEKNTPF